MLSFFILSTEYIYIYILRLTNLRKVPRFIISKGTNFLYFSYILTNIPIFFTIKFTLVNIRINVLDQTELIRT